MALAAGAPTTAAEVKHALRRRHPATQQMGVRTVPGPWVCVEEWRGIDLLALSAVKRPATGAISPKVPYPRVGYEVKVNRSDYYAELRKPEKRAEAVAACHEFYFAVPRGLLRIDEFDTMVPSDVGLIIADGRGCHVQKPAPGIIEPEPIVTTSWGLHDFIRWVSARPDPRHEGVVDRARAAAREARAEHTRRQAEYLENSERLGG